VGAARVAHAPFDILAQRFEQRGVDDPINLGVLEGLETPVLTGRGAPLLDAAQRTRRVPRDGKDRVREEMHGQRARRQGEADRIDQERHVVVHHLDDGMRRCVAVLAQGRIEDPHQCATAAFGGELQMRQGRGREISGGARRHVVRINVGVIGRQEPFVVGSAQGFRQPRRRGYHGRHDPPVLHCACLMHGGS
jgi:hypothetical protein